MSERALISPNVPNFITIGVMAIGFFVAFALVWQLASKMLGRSTSGGEGAAEVEGSDFAPS